MVMILAFNVVGGLAWSTLVGNLDLGLYQWRYSWRLTVLWTFIILGQMAIVYQKSNSLIRMMKVKQSGPAIPFQDRKWEERFYRSCSALKIVISSGNFVAILTPLNCNNSKFLLLNGSKTKITVVSSLL